MLRRNKKIIAIILSLVLVVTGTIFVPKNAKAAMTDFAADTWVSTGAWELYTNNSWGAAYEGGTAGSPQTLVYDAKGNEWFTPNHFMQTSTAYSSSKSYDYSISVTTSTAIGAGNFCLLEGPAQSSGDPNPNLTLVETGAPVIGGGTATFSGTWTPAANNNHLYLRLYDAGQTLTFNTFSVTESGAPTETQTETSTEAPTQSSEWILIANGGPSEYSNKYFYNDNTKTNISSVGNIQKPAFADEYGVYITVPAAISSGGVLVNGKSSGVAGIQGAGVVVYLSAMDDYINEVNITYSGGVAHIQIKNTSALVPPTITSATLVYESSTLIPGAVAVTWSCTGAPSTEKYNVYVDGNLVKSEIPYNKLTTTVNNLASGDHIIGVSGVAGKTESEISTKTVTGVTAVKNSSKIDIEGFQIRSNYGTGESPSSVAFRTMCRAPKVGKKLTVGGTEYTVASLGTIYALDTNKTGDNASNTLDASYTLLDPDSSSGTGPSGSGLSYTYTGLRDSTRTFGYVATENAIISDFKPADTDNSYYAFTMQNMDGFMENTIWVRPFIVATNGTIIYGKLTAFTSVAEIGYELYTGSMSKNLTAHEYLFDNICNAVNSSNAFYLASEKNYGYNGKLYIGFRKIPDAYSGGEQDEMQYNKIGDYIAHATSFYQGAAASYKGVTSDEMAIRVDNPGGPMFNESDMYNWGIQIKYSNRKAYARLSENQIYEMTLSYKTTNAGFMNVKMEGLSTDRTIDITGDGIGAQPIAYPAAAGYNSIKYRFKYTKALMRATNDASIVLSLGGGRGADTTGFPAGTIVSDVDFTFTEVDD